MSGYERENRNVLRPRVTAQLLFEEKFEGKKASVETLGVLEGHAAKDTDKQVS